MKKKVLSLVLALALVLAPCVSALGEEEPPAAQAGTYVEFADALYSLGLFLGTGADEDGNPVYDLDSDATRVQALVMLLRLLGEEGAALACTETHPFADVPQGHWAYRYVAYAYAMGYTFGTGDTTFSPDEPVTVNMYLTYLMRALRYSDAAGDFNYARAFIDAEEAGIINGDLYSSGDTVFKRDDCAYTSFLALSADMKGGGWTLADSLIWQKGVFTREAYDAAVGDILSEIAEYTAAPKEIADTARLDFFVNGEPVETENKAFRYDYAIYLPVADVLSALGVDVVETANGAAVGAYVNGALVEAGAGVPTMRSVEATFSIKTAAGEYRTPILTNGVLYAPESFFEYFSDDANLEEEYSPVHGYFFTTSLAVDPAASGTAGLTPDRLTHDYIRDVTSQSSWADRKATSGFSFTDSWGRMSGQWLRAGTSPYAFQCYFTLETGGNGGEYTMTFPYSETEADTVSFTAEPNSTYKLTYTYPLSTASASYIYSGTIWWTGPNGLRGSFSLSFSGGTVSRGSLSVEKQ